jgi:hypothetical protein
MILTGENQRTGGKPVPFPLTLKTFLLFVTVVMLLSYQSPVNCRTRNTEGNFTHKVNYHYYCHIPGLEFTGT